MIKKLLFIGLLLIAVIGIPSTIYLSQQKQDTRSHATAATTLSLIPQPGPSNNIQVTKGAAVPVDLVVDPGSVNVIIILHVQIAYDPTKLQPDTLKPFSENPNLPPPLTPPYIDSTHGTISFNISLGTDISKVISTKTTVGTYNFTAINPTDGTPSLVTVTNNTAIFSNGPTDQSSENVLSSSTPAQITILDRGPTPTLTPTLTPTNTPAPIPNTTTTPTNTPTPTSTPAPVNTNGLALTAFLHNIGNSGDNTNPTAFSLSNKTPLQQPRSFTVSVYDANTAQLVTTKVGSLPYSAASGNYSGIFPLGISLAEGDYIIKVKTNNFLQKKVPGFFHITPATQTALPAITLTAGDSNGDNALNILDYNMITDCYSDFLPPIACDDTKKGQTDLNDDGSVNTTDLNLFLRELKVQNGD